MFAFNSLCGNLHHVCVPKGIGAGKVHTMIEGFPRYDFQPGETVLQQTILWKAGEAIIFTEKRQAAGTERIPRPSMKYPVEKFYNCHENLSNELNKLVNQSSSSHNLYSNFYNPISDIISEYEQNLIHLHKDILDLFFNYTDLLEAVLLVSKRRRIAAQNFTDIINKLNDVYGRIYSKMASNDNSNVSALAEELSCVREEVGNRNLLPTFDEYDQEIAETVASMSDKEKENLTSALFLFN